MWVRAIGDCCDWNEYVVRCWDEFEDGETRSVWDGGTVKRTGRGVLQCVGIRESTGGEFQCCVEGYRGENNESKRDACHVAVVADKARWCR